MSGTPTELQRLPKGLVAKKLAVLREQRERAADMPAARARQALQDAGAVLAVFNPLHVVPFGVEANDTAGLDEARLGFLADCEPLEDAPAEAGWRLKAGVRETALQRLKNAERLRAARAANPGVPLNTLQRMLDALLAGRPPNLDELNQEELVVLLTAVRWLESVLDDLPAATGIEVRLAQRRLIEPLERLAGQHFVGRHDELERLVAFLESDAIGPLRIHGSGGVGKSTLLARFILDRVLSRRESSQAFVRLDADHPGLDPREPLTFYSQILRQLASQLIPLRADLTSLSDSVHEALDRADITDATKITDPSFQEWLLRQAAERLEPALNGRNLLLVVDSFEAVQIVGEEAATQVLELLADLARALPSVRLILAGRVPIAGPGEAMHVGDLKPGPARELIEAELHAHGFEDATGRLAGEVVELVGGNPLVLRLAAHLIMEAGVGALAEADRRGEVLQQISVGARQGRLYGRILAHLHDRRVRALALPSVILRRVDAEVIRNVLADPCAIDVPDDATAAAIFQAMLREVALVEHDRTENSLRHRTDVREAMLASLADEVPFTKLRAIEDGAIAFYAGRAGGRARAEELYHRLHRGDPVSHLHWDPEAAPFLSAALQELPVEQRAWLAERLDVSVAGSERAGLISDEAWAAQAARVAERWLLSHRPDEALAAIRERPLRTVELARLEVQALVQAGNLDAAEEAATRGIELARAIGRHEVASELLRYQGEILERQGELERAVRAAEAAIGEADRVDGDAPEQKLTQRLRGLTVLARLLRREGESHNLERRQVIETIKTTIRDLPPRLLHQHPVTIRELAAEIGHLVPEVLADAVETVGLELDSTERADELTRAVIANGIADEKIVRERREKDPLGFERYARSITQRELASAPASSDFAKSLVDLFRSSVDKTLGF